MAINSELLGPKEGEEEAYAVEALVFSVQIALQRAMTRKGVSNRDLAERLGMTPARVSQIFATKGANLTLKTIARIQHALGEEFEFVRKDEIKPAQVNDRSDQFTPYLRTGNRSMWREYKAHNSNRQVQPAAA